MKVISKKLGMVQFSLTDTRRYPNGGNTLMMVIDIEIEARVIMT
jgi:hypothetical protein